MYEWMDEQEKWAEKQKTTKKTCIEKEKQQTKQKFMYQCMLNKLLVKGK